MHKLATTAVAILLGLMLASAPIGRNAVAQNADEGEDYAFFFFALAFGVFDTFNADERARVVASERETIIHAYEQALNGLHRGDAGKFYRNRNVLREKSQDAYQNTYDVPPRFKALARFAYNLLSTLPDQYVAGFVFLRDDGTPVADPDAFIRSQLMREKDFLLNGASGDGGGGAD